MNTVTRVGVMMVMRNGEYNKKVFPLFGAQKKGMLLMILDYLFQYASCSHNCLKLSYPIHQDILRCLWCCDVFKFNYFADHIACGSCSNMVMLFTDIYEVERYC